MNWFKHDIGSLEDDRFSFLVDRYGSDGYAVFFLIVEELYRNGGNPIGSLSLSKIAKQLSLGKERVLEIAEYACSDECEGLLEKDGRKYSSERVRSAIEDKDRKVKQTKEAVRKRWENYYKKMNANADALRTYNERKTDVIQIRGDKIRGDKIREDKNDKSSSNEESLSLEKNPSILNRLEGKEKSAADAAPDRPADGGSSRPYVTLKDGSSWTVSDFYQVSMQKAFPKVDAMVEFWKMAAKTKEFPKSRPTLATVGGFVNEWMLKATSEADGALDWRRDGGSARGVVTDHEERMRGVSPDGTYTI